jgi:hypothetical protein
MRKIIICQSDGATQALRLIALAKFSLTGDPESVTHIIKGSEPTLSAVALPLVVGALPGKVTGTVAPHLLPPLAVTVTATMLLPSEERV